MTNDEYWRVVELSAGVHELLSNKTRWELLQAWRETYASNLHALTGPGNTVNSTGIFFRFSTPALSGETGLWRPTRPRDHATL